MGWNEPPGGDKGKDPWGNRGNGEGPPDLDEIVRKMQQGLGGIFGKRPGSVGNNDGSTLPWVLGIILLLIWTAYDISYVIDQQERGVVLRFGAHVETLLPGLNFRFPRPVEKVYKVNVGQVRSITHKATMLTQDENIVDVEVAVQWQIGDANDYLFNVFSPSSTLRQVTESAVREVIGKNVLDFVLTEGRSEIAEKQRALIQETLNDYKSGIKVLSVEMQPAKPPDEVKAAFDDAIKAREDEQRLVNESEAYRNDIIPRARGAAARLREEANGYKARIIAKAEGEASRFDQLYAEYQRAPAVTRQRLYLDAIENVFSNTNKVLMDNEGGGNSLMYLPIDRLLEKGGVRQSPAIPQGLSQERSSASPPPQGTSNSGDSRTRRGR
jgi:membrane protease subunit HflK